MTTVYEQFQHCIEYEYTHMAHRLYHLLKENLVKADDDFQSVDFSKADEAKVKEMVEQNYLCFSLIKVFSLKVDDYLFAFIFAKSKEEAIEYAKSELKEKPKNCFEYPLDIEMERGEKKILTFRDMKKEHDSFPTLAGYYETNPAYR